MANDRTVSLTISLPQSYRDLVRKKAAEWSVGITGLFLVPQSFLKAFFKQFIKWIPLETYSFKPLNPIG